MRLGVSLALSLHGLRMPHDNNLIGNRPAACEINQTLGGTLPLRFVICSWPDVR